MKKLISIIGVVATLLALCLPAFATSSFEEQVLSKVTDLYADYYDISDAMASIVSNTENEDGSITYVVDISFKRTLKETSAYDMPYIQGLQEAASQLTDPAKIAAAEKRIELWVAELENNYIGIAQDTNVTISMTIPHAASARSTYTVAATDMQAYDDLLDEEFPLESIRPKSDEESRAEGQATIDELAVAGTTVYQMESIQKSDLLPIQKYNRVVARNYARNWSCDTGKLNDHESCHNPSYSFENGVDCANFVSQCLKEGGLCPDDTWYPDQTNGMSTAWYTTGNRDYGIRDYVVDKEYFFHSTSDYDAFAGSIINLLNSDGSNEGHVGLVDQNDTRTMTFCAHSKCRRSKTFSWFSHRDFYVPCWDSETNSWTQ